MLAVGKKKRDLLEEINSGSAPRLARDSLLLLRILPVHLPFWVCHDITDVRCAELRFSRSKRKGKQGNNARQKNAERKLGSFHSGQHCKAFGSSRADSAFCQSPTARRSLTERPFLEREETLPPTTSQLKKRAFFKKWGGV